MAENDYHTIENVPSRGDAGYRLMTYEYDEGNAMSTTPNQHVFFALSDQKTVNKQITHFTNYRYKLTGVDVDGHIALNDVMDDQLLFLIFHVVDIGTSPDSTTIESVREQFEPGTNDMFELNNNVSRSFGIENILNDHYYYIFFNVYSTKNDQSSIIYSSLEDYTATGYNPIDIQRITLDISNVMLESNYVSISISALHAMTESDHTSMYKITVRATPVLV